jgi:hypothetical protein
MQKKYLWGLGLVAVLAVGAVAVGNGHFLGYKLVHHGMDGAHDGAGQGHMHGADGTGHDEVNMPGLRGENATREESAELAVMFRNFQTLSREVTELPNGIRTVTRSSDPDVMENLVSHVTGMIGRVETANDPKIPIQSPTLDIFFARGDKITTDIDVTDEGIVVVQTSDDPEVVKALHIHAGEVSDMADRGMAAVHEMMMKRASGN